MRQFSIEHSRARERHLHDVMDRDKEFWKPERRDRYARLFDALNQRQGICPLCAGEGTIETTHPLWGTRSCPEPYVQITCPDCDGDGAFDWDAHAEYEGWEWYSRDGSSPPPAGASEPSR
jgi:hypothetical protein